jgi:hypothetical protein
METKLSLARDWDGAPYSPNTQTSIYPFVAAGFIPGCCNNERVIVAWTVTNNSGDDAYLQVRNTNDEGALILSVLLPAGQTTSYQFPIRTEGQPFVCISSTPNTYTAVGTPGDFSGTFFTR